MIRKELVMKKKFILISLLLIVLIGLGGTYYLMFKERKVIVFAYHKIVPQEIKELYYNDNVWVDTTERFEEQMKYLYENGYTTLSMNEYEDWRKGKMNIPLKTVMITIDDGDIETYYEMMPILKKYKFKATYFMIGEKVQEVSELYDNTTQQFLGLDLINKIKKEYPNLEIQSHSYYMHNRIENIPYVVNMSKEQIDNDFEKMEFLDTDIYCYPYGVHTNTILDVLEEKKYRIAFKLDKSGISTREDDKFLIQRVGINNETSFTSFKKWLLKAIIS